MKRIPLTLVLAFVVLFQAGTARAAMNPETQDVLDDYQELLEEVPWGVGGKDFGDAKDLLKAAKKAEKNATELGLAHLQRVQMVTNLIMALEHAKVGGRGWKSKATYRFAGATKDWHDLQKAFKADNDLVQPVVDAAKVDAEGTAKRYGEALKDTAKETKEKLDALLKLIKEKKDKP